MAGLKVFVSSTCYDLSILRSDLRLFLSSLGYEPIMSDYADVLYDPRQHTHTSCVDEVSNCDMLIVVIGARYGGKGVPEALERIETSSLKNYLDNFDETNKSISITQLEVMKAIECNIPIYVFIDKKVYYEHEVYEKNKDVADEIIFPAIEKQETAKYIFTFIDFLRLKSIGNSIFQFEQMQDIEETLKKQWSGYFQKLLYEQRYKNEERKRMDVLSEQFQDLKTAILSSIENLDQREVANGIVKYRRMSEFLFGIKFTKSQLVRNTDSFNDLLKSNNIIATFDSRKLPDFQSVTALPITFLIKSDNTFFECRYPYDFLDDMSEAWESFKNIKEKTKEIIIDSLEQMYRPSLLRYRYHDEFFSKYLIEHNITDNKS